MTAQAFEGKRSLARQQMVFKILWEEMQGARKRSRKRHQLLTFAHALAPAPSPLSPLPSSLSPLPSPLSPPERDVSLFVFPSRRARTRSRSDGPQGAFRSVSESEARSRARGQCSMQSLVALSAGLCTHALVKHAAEFVAPGPADL